MGSRLTRTDRLAASLAVLGLAGTVFAQSTDETALVTAVIWADRAVPGTPALDGGSDAPGPGPGTAFRFISEPASGTSPKFEVEDERGVRWKVKLGEEARAETAAVHLLRSVGYLVDDAYYRAEILVTALPRLARGQQFVSAGGIVRGARLEAAGSSAPAHAWSWFDNPLLGTREFNGLRVMMALINNWDLKEVNNSAPDEPGGDGRHRVTDLGATFGRTGNVLLRSKGNAAEFANAPFIARVTATHVDFVMHSRPLPVTVFNIRNYRSRTRMERVTKAIPLDDARWIGGVLGRLSRAELADAFLTAGFTPAETNLFVAALQTRIAGLNQLPAGAIPVAPGPPDTRPAGVRSIVPRCQLDTCRQAPLRERVTPFSLRTPFVRGVLGGFEQGAGIGFGAQVTSAHLLQHVEFRATAFGSTRLYRRLELEALIPHAGSSRMHAAFRLADLRRDVDFAGIGPRSPATALTRFALAQRSYQGVLTRDLAEHLQGGLYAQRVSAMTSPGTAAEDAPAAFDAWLPGFLTRTRIRSFGAYVAFDNRDDRIGLTRGLNLYARVADAGGPGASAEAPTYGWREAELDIRGHIPLGGHRTSLLARARTQLKVPKGGGRQIPFHDLSYLGGRAYLRGYQSFRFRANSVLLLSSELQRTVREITPVRGVDLFASADAGQVWGEEDLAAGPRIWRTGFGGGLQYRHTRHLAARLEASWSAERTLAYASLSRGF